MNNLRYADDTTLLAESDKDLKVLIKKVKEASMKAGLVLNLKKAKLTSMQGTREFKVDDEDLEVLEKFVFLGSLMNRENDDCSQEIRRLVLGRAATSKLTIVWRDKHVSIGTKARLVNALVLSVVMYGYETWAIKAADQQQINAFELCC